MIAQCDRTAEADFGRTLILGNSGSGKSWLAAQMAEVLWSKAVDLDTIHWEPGGYNMPRDKQIALDMVRQAALRPAWIIEGVYGWLAQEALPQASALIWLDLPVGECLDNLRQRGLRRGGDAASFKALLAWATDYPHRHTSSSLEGHKRTFASFPGHKLCLQTREPVTDFMTKLPAARS